MCGIIGRLERNGGDEPIGVCMTAMLSALGRRGPDSAGVALYGPPAPDKALILQIALGDDLEQRAAQVLSALRQSGNVVAHEHVASYLSVTWQPAGETTLDAAVAGAEAAAPGCEVVSVGRQLTIVKQVGTPERLNDSFGLARARGSHFIGHTRLCTESRVDLSHSQPFWGRGVPDLASVHNGHITNYHKLRRLYEQHGVQFHTENDSEVIGIYLRDRMARGDSLQEALARSVKDFDGSFCYLVAWEGGMTAVKDRFGLKPLVVAETDRFVAVATEEIALRAALEGEYDVREPAPGSVLNFEF